MTKKIKLTEAAKDLKIDNQELIDLMEKYDGTKRKNTTALSADEMNYILEHYSQSNQVESFDRYFDSKNHPVSEEKEEEKPAQKAAQKRAKARNPLRRKLQKRLRKLLRRQKRNPKTRQLKRKHRKSLIQKPKKLRQRASRTKRI